MSKRKMLKNILVVKKRMTTVSTGHSGAWQVAGVYSSVREVIYLAKG